MKITKKQLKQIIYHEIKRTLKESNGDQFRQNLLKYFPEEDVSGALGKKPVVPPDEDPEEAAFKKLTLSMGLIEKAMLYMMSEGGDEGKSPVEVVSLIHKLLSEEKNETN